MQKPVLIRYICLILSVLLMAGCGSTNPSIQLVELNSNTITYEEVIRINNCGGKADSEQTVSHSFSTSIEGEGKFSVGYQPIVEGEISAKYGQYRNTTKSQRLVAPPGTDMQFVLRWSEDVRAGNVAVDGAAGTYQVRIPIAVEQVSSQDLGCGSATTQSAQGAPPAQSTQSLLIEKPAATMASQSSRILLGLWVWQGNRPPMPPPAGPGQVIFANGDIDNSGTCHVKEFGPGEPVEGLGEGTFQLWLITGTPEQIAFHEAIIQQGAANDPNNPTGTCPMLP